jgi:hypothetical protein
MDSDTDRDTVKGNMASMRLQVVVAMPPAIRDVVGI